MRRRNFCITILLALFVPVCLYIYQSFFHLNTFFPDVVINNEKIIQQNQDNKFIIYKNDIYGFSLKLPLNWKGYTVVESDIDKGKKITIQYPPSISEVPHMDIPILIYTQEQWHTWELNNFEGYQTAAPIGPTKRAENLKYVFATAPRYNFSFQEGFEEVEKIIQDIQAF